MACLICPKPICLELRFVTPEDENVADLVLQDTSECGPRAIPVGIVEVDMLDFFDKPILPESGSASFAFRPGEHSLTLHALQAFPKSLSFRFSQEKDAGKDAQQWGPVKRGAIQIGNEALQKEKNASGPSTPSQKQMSVAEKNARSNGWGFLSATYQHFTPPFRLNVHKILEEREEKGEKYQFPASEKELKRFFDKQRAGAVDMLHAKRGECPVCSGTQMYRMVIELRGLTCLKPRLHVVNNWSGGDYTPRYGNYIQPTEHPFFADTHTNNALNLGAFAALAYATLELNSDKDDDKDNGRVREETGSIYDVFRDLSFGVTPRQANTTAVTLFLERRPYGEGYPLEGLAYFYDKKMDAEGFAASDAQTIIIGFRGTASLEDVKTDGKVLLSSYEEIMPKPAAVHLGFKQSVEALRQKVLDYCDKHKAREKRIFVCGHSLGGAMATIMALALQKEYGNRINLYTYGSPRVGNMPFIHHLLEHDIVHYRYVNHNDVVPHIPPQDPTLLPAVLLKRVPVHKSPHVYFLHHGNFCHIMEHHGYEWAQVRLRQEAIRTAQGTLLTEDSATTGWRENIKLLRYGTSHYMDEYLRNMEKALANRTVIWAKERGEADKATAHSYTVHFKKLPMGF